MIRSILFVFILILSAGIEVAETQPVIRGKIIDAVTKKPVPFAHVIVRNGDSGSVTKPDGRFELNISQNELPDSLLISSLGYHDKIVAADTQNYLYVELIPRVYKLNDISVRVTGVLRRDTVGTETGNTNLYGWPSFSGSGSRGDMLSSFAIPVTWPHKIPFSIDKARIMLSEANQDTLFIRFRIMSRDPQTGLPDSNLVNQNIVVAKSKSSGWVEFDLETGQYWFSEKEIFLVFDWISDGGSDKYIAPMFAHKPGSGHYFFYKHATGGSWSRHEKELVYTVFGMY